NHTDCPLTDFGGKTSIFSHPVYLFLRKFSLQDSRGGSVCMPLITHLLNVEELSRLLKNVALSVINLFILDDVSEKMEYIPDWVVVTRLNIWWR
ncbi:hypothetical protein ACIL8I_22855, partial [Escherichia coli]|uniref:hypothetical protein n=1 Tax=Escherichia coli TaxID=562 RepID=UPI0039BCAA93